MAYNIAQTEQYIRSAAKARGIDPDVAVRVAKSEGLAKGVYQSNLSRGAEREPSYGPFQLLVGGEGTSYPTGMGNDFVRQTGLDPSDPSTVPQQVDFALDNASKNGWGAWYGAKAAGIGTRDGIGGTPSSTAPIADSGGETTLYGGTGADTLANPMPQNGGLGGLGGFLDSGNGGDLMQALGYSLMASPHNAPLSGLGEFLPAIQDRREKKDLLAKAEAKENRTLSYLRQNFPEIATQVDAGLPVADAFKLAADQRKAALGGTNEYGLTPQYGVDKDGNPVLIQLSKGGTAQQTALPDGVSLSKEPIKLDAGTHFVLLDPITRQPVGTIPKDNFGAAKDAAVGKAVGENEGAQSVAAPGDLQAAENTLGMIQSLRDDPNRERGTGMSSVFNNIPGTAGYDYANKVEQAKSGAFLTAIQQMRGLGSLSNTEGETATAAVNRMNVSTSEEEFNAALDDYEKIVRQGYERAKKRVGGAAPADPAAPAAPAGSGSKSKLGVTWSVE